MSERLDTVCSLIERTNIIADVGCDHAIVAEYCINNRLAETVVASDISENCLEKARARLKSADNVRFVCCDGIKYECDEAVIAGMGGSLISEILLAAETLPETLIVCPHRNDECVRATLLRLGYGIDKDIPIAERGKYYSVIRAKKGAGSAELSELQMLFGIDCAKPNAALAARLKVLYNAYKHAPQKNAQQLKNVTAALELQGVQIE